ncbi:MAG TPA: HIT domain-containing protein [Kiritimatiellia bacterium]|nr:HIT domain-containing protein [Kiritimatiellia bacterium]HSA17530.1 HIT domain-containing protein [Kiritimatiellia bacterium]
MAKKKGPRHILWAPWRMEYIKRPRESGCFLCNSLRSRADRANGVVLRGRTCAVVLNRYPYTGGHLMVAPLRHVAALDGLTKPELNEMIRLMMRSLGLLRKALHPHGFNVGLNIGEAAGAGLKDHVHLHIVPRWNGDTNFMPVLGKTQVTPVSLGSLWDLLRGK